MLKTESHTITKCCSLWNHHAYLRDLSGQKIVSFGQKIQNMCELASADQFFSMDYMYGIFFVEKIIIFLLYILANRPPSTVCGS